LVSFFLAGFLAQDEFQRILNALQITEFSKKEMDYIGELDFAVLEPLRHDIEEDGFSGILDTGRRKFIHDITELRAHTIKNSFQEIWHVKELPDNSKIHEGGEANPITFLEEYGLVRIPEEGILVSRTVQPVVVGKGITPPSVFIFPDQDERTLMENVPFMNAFGGGLGLYANFRAVELSRKFKRKFGCPADVAFVCVGYFGTFESGKVQQTVDGYLPEWLIN
jgi:hypothetical protein